MGNIIRVANVEINHLKNVKRGSFNSTSTINRFDQSDIIGFYGQNGSGKTAVVDAFKLLKTLLKADKNDPLPLLKDNLIMYGEQSIELLFNFIISNRYKEYFVKYTVKLIEGNERLEVANEEIWYKENEKNKRFKMIVAKRDKEIFIRNKNMKDMNEAMRISIEVANRMALGNATSFVFQQELKELFDSSLNEFEFELMNNLKRDFNRDLHIIDTTQYGLLVANIIMPFSIHYENKRGHIPYEMKDTTILPVALYETMKDIIEQTNIVLKTIIPDLQIKINKINVQTLDDGRKGVRFEFLSKRNHIELPIRSESEGILKIISILNTLIAVYNNPNACVVIDELDSGIFEYLLGELLEVLHEGGSGQLLFTSHNLRILEVLPVSNLWFTTMNEADRYLQLKGVQKLSNARDIYLRAIQLGGQNEKMYAETDLYDIKKSFRRAGRSNEKK